MTSVVRPSMSLESAACTWRSDSVSSAEVASASTSTGAFFNSARAIASHNMFDDACGIVAKQATDLIATDNQLWTGVEPDGTDLTRWSVVGISTTAAASVTASGNRLDGMVISLASQRRSFVRGNTIRHVPLVRQYGINQRAAVTYKSAVPDYHEVEGNTVDAGVLPVYRHQPKGESR